MNLKPGDVVRCGERLDDTYIFALVKDNHYALICISNGNRYSDRNLGSSPSLSDLNNVNKQLMWEYVGRLDDGN